jgi:hypothetical protein
MRGTPTLITLAGTMLAVLIALPHEAEARFGKGGSGGPRPSAPRPVARYYGGPYYGGYYGAYYGAPYYPYYYPHYYYSPAPPPPPAAPSPIFALGTEGQFHSGGQGGGTLALNLGVEGERFGFSTRFAGIFAPSQDGTGGTDNINLFDASLTYAVVATDAARLRVEGGAAVAFAPDMTAVGPMVGLSTRVDLVGPLGLDGSIHYVPFPYTEVDGALGLGLNFGPFSLRAGWREIFLDDHGWVDGVTHRDTFGGPYAGLAFRL